MILMNVNSCHICVSISDEDHDLGNARLLLPRDVSSCPRQFHHSVASCQFAPWWFLSFSLITPLCSTKFIFPNYELVFSALLFQNENKNIHTIHKTHGTFILIQHLGLPSCFIFSKPPTAELWKSWSIYLL